MACPWVHLENGETGVSMSRFILIMLESRQQQSQLLPTTMGKKWNWKNWWQQHEMDENESRKWAALRTYIWRPFVLRRRPFVPSNIRGTRDTSVAFRAAPWSLEFAQPTPLTTFSDCRARSSWLADGAAQFLARPDTTWAPQADFHNVKRIWLLPSLPSPRWRCCRDWWRGPHAPA